MIARYSRVIVISRSARRRLSAWIGLLALLGGTLVTPLAHALTLRAAAVGFGNDFCSAAKPVAADASTRFAGSNNSGGTHSRQCEFCSGCSKVLARDIAGAKPPLPTVHPVVALNVVSDAPVAPKYFGAARQQAPPILY